MAKRKSLNKRFSRYSRGSGGSNVLNPDTDILGDEHPFWWRNLENNTIIRQSTDSTNFNQTSRRLNSNSSIRTSNELDDSWWKVLEGTPRNLKSLQKIKDLSKKDANNGASEISESEEEVKITKKKPCLQSETKKVDGNAFLSILKNLKVLLIPLEEDPAFQKSSFAQGFVSTNRISNDSKQLNKVSDTESSSIGSPGIVAKPKPKILQENIRNRNANAFEGDKLAPTLKRMSLRKSLPTDKRFSIAADSPVIAAAANSREAQKSLTESDHDLSNCPVPKATSTILGSSSLSQQNSVENSNSETEPVVIKPKSKLLTRRDKDTKKNLFMDILMEDKINEEKAADQMLSNASTVVDESVEEPEPRIEVDETTEELEPRIVEDESNDSSDTSYTFLEPVKPKSKFLRNMCRSLKESLYQKIVDESDSSITKGTLNLSQNDNNKQTMRRPSVISANSNVCSEDVHLRLSNSSKGSDIEIIKTGNNKPFSSWNSNIEIASSQSENQGRNVSFAAYYDEEMGDHHSDVTLIIPPSNDFDRRQSQHTSSRLKLSIEEVANLKKGSVEIKDSAVAENADDASDIVRDLNRSRKRSMSSSVQQIAVEEAAISQQRMKLQEYSGPAIFNEDGTEHDGEAASRRDRSLNKLRKKSVPHAGSVSEAEQSDRTPSRKRLENVRTPKRESRDAKRSVSNTISQVETEVAESPLRKQSKRTSKTQEQVSTPAKENSLVEIEDVSPRPSQRLSSNRKGALQTLVSESEVEVSQTSAKRQSKRTSKVQEQILTPVKENAPVEIEDVPPRPSQRLSRTRKRASQSVASESEVEASHTPVKRQSKRTSKMQEQILTPVKENAPVEIEDVSPRRSQRLSKTRKDASQTLVSESEVEASQTPVKRQSKQTSKMQEQILTPVKENAPVEIEDLPPKPSQRLSRTRKGVSQTLVSESEVEASQTPAKRQSKRTSKMQEQILTPVKENAPVEIEDVSPRRSQRLSKTRKDASQTLVSESEVEASQTPAKRQSKRTNKTLNQLASGPVKESEPWGTVQSQRPNRTQREMSLMAASESGAENSFVSIAKRDSRAGKRSGPRTVSEAETGDVVSPSTNQSKRVSNMQEQTVPIAAMENEPIQAKNTATKQSQRSSKIPEEQAEAEDTSPQQSHRLSRAREGRQLAIASESEVEGIQSPSKKGRGRTSMVSEQVAPIEAEDTAPRPSRRLVETENLPSVFPDSDFEAENLHTSSKQQGKRIERAERQSVPTDTDENEQTEPENIMSRSSKTRRKEFNEPVKAEDPRQRRSQRQSKPRRIASLLSTDDSETEGVNPPTEKLYDGTSSLGKQIITVATIENEPMEAEDARQTHSKRRSKPRRVTSLSSSSDSEAENPETPTKQQKKRTSSSKKQTVENEPIEAEDVRQRRSKRRSKPRRVTSLLPSSDSEADNIEFPTESRNERTGSLKKRSLVIDRTENEPIDAENIGRRQSERQSSVCGAARLNFSTRFDSEDDGPDSSDDDKPTGAKDAEQSRSQRLSNARRARSSFFTDGTEAEAPTKSQRERARRTQIRVVSISSKEETMAESSVQKETSLLFFNNSDRDNSVVRTFLEKRPRDRDQSKQNSILDKEDDVDSAVKSPLVLPTGETGTENFRKPSSTSLKERSRRSRNRSKLSRVDQPEEIEKEDERTEVDRVRNVSSIAEELELTSPRRSTIQERFQTVPYTEKRSLIPRKRSESKVEKNIEVESRSTARVATEETSATRRKQDKVSIRSITKLDATIEDVGVDRSPLRLVIDQNAVRVESPSRVQNKPGPSGKSGSLRPFSLKRIEGELGSESVSKMETENLPKTVHGRTSNLKADAGKGKSSAAPQRIQKGQRNMMDFFNTNGTAIPASQALSNAQMAQEIRKKVDEIKKREVEGEMKEIRKLTVAAVKSKSRPRPRPRPRHKQQNSVPRKVDKAYLVNGLVYKPPRLPRPKRWVTDRLYQYLWKQMEPKFKLETRVQSEKFVCRLSEVTGVIAKRKTYVSYKNELYGLMKEMARLQIIHNRYDFYNFCHDFLPYELRAKMVPILLPGNQRTIPYDPSKLHEPLFSP